MIIEYTHCKLKITIMNTFYKPSRLYYTPIFKQKIISLNSLKLIKY